MKIQNLISKVLLKVAPITAPEHDDIQRNMDVWFSKQQEAAKIKKTALANNEPDAAPLTIKDKAILILDEWYVKALFAISFIFIVRYIQDFMNPGDDGGEDDYPEHGN